MTLQNPGRALSVHKGMVSAGGWLWYIGGILVLSFAGNLYKGDMWLALGSLIFGILLLISPLLRWRQSMELFENGFVLKRLTGTRSVSRDEIAFAKLTSHYSRIGHSVEVEIGLKNGAAFSVVGMSDSEQLYNTLNAWRTQNESAGGDGPNHLDASGHHQPASGIMEGGWVPPSERNTP